jgi:RNA polymerase sigma-70 factor (ECF subfamily)
MPALSDREIVEQAIAGDPEAFRLLVERHQRFVYSLAYRFVHNISDAEDITQDTFIRLWKNLGRYRHEVKLTTWLYKIVTNLCLDLLKSAYTKNTRRLEDLADQSALQSEWEADQPILTEEARVALVKMTAALTPKQKVVFVLRDIEDLTTDEICDILSMSSGNVKSNLYYARKKIGEMMVIHYQTKKFTKQ